MTIKAQKCSNCSVANNMLNPCFSWSKSLSQPNSTRAQPFFVTAADCDFRFYAFLSSPWTFSHLCRALRSGQVERLGLGVDRGQLTEEEDEFSTYRKRMMLSYKFRPNPMVSPNQNLVSKCHTGFQLESNFSSFRKIPDATTTRGWMWNYSWSMINLYQTHTGSCLALPMSSPNHNSDA